jgi:hypothetical protein
MTLLEGAADEALEAGVERQKGEAEAVRSGG